MKVRVCPSCGKVNEELAFHCSNCGQTLSIKTLMDTDSERFLQSTPHAGEIALINISPAFQEEAGRILSGLPEKESYTWGCNVTTLSDSAPYKFGFLIFTTRQLILTYYDSALDEAGFPERSNLAFLPTALESSGSGARESRLMWALDFPQSALTPAEVESRFSLTVDYKQVVSASLAQNLVGDAAIARLNVKLSGMEPPIPGFLRSEQHDTASDEISISFIFPEDAEKALLKLNDTGA